MNQVPESRTLRDLAREVQLKGDGILSDLFGDSPVLLVRPINDDEGGTFLVSTAPDGNPTEKIQHDAKSTSERPAFSEYPPLGEGANLVVPVAKSTRNPFVGVITVGRAGNNDLILNTPNVSKLHAFLSAVADGWQVEDRGSTNGTMVDGVRLAEKTPHRLQYGSEVTFGGVGGLFVQSPQLASLCRMVDTD